MADNDIEMDMWFHNLLVEKTMDYSPNIQKKKTIQKQPQHCAQSAFAESYPVLAITGVCHTQPGSHLLTYPLDLL